MPNAERRARQLSWLYYNQGLERAQARDLSGAEIKLRESLQLHKRNIPARNLLGLVYFETGEAVAALQEWLLSEHFQARENPATEYIARMRKNSAQIRQMNEAIATYNKALQNCREGNDDIAAIQLRRILSHHPKYLRAAQLLALIDIKEGKLAQARKVLHRIGQTDKANPLTLRYLAEIENQINEQTKGRRSREIDEEEGEAENAEGSRAARFRDRPAFSSLVNILIGLGLGILTAALVVVPAVRRNVSQSTNTRIVDYTTTIAEQKDRIKNLEDQINESNAVVAEATKQVESSKKESDSYDRLIKAYNYYDASDPMKAYDELAEVDPEKLSTTAVEIYNHIRSAVRERAYEEYQYAGDVAHYQENWKEAIRCYEKAIEIKMDDSDVLNLLAGACEKDGQTDKAIQYYQMILDKFPDSRRAENAEYMITILGGTPRLGGESAAAEENTENTENTEEENNVEDTEDEYVEEGTDEEYVEEYVEEYPGEYVEEYTEEYSEEYSEENYDG